MPAAVRESFEASMKSPQGQMSSTQNGITASCGNEAEQPLAETRAGSTLIDRQKAATQNTGLTSTSTYKAGRYVDGKLAPIPIDGSFKRALAVCGIK